MRVVRVFPRRTSMTPTDALSFVGDPPLPAWRPDADEVHVSVTFTWDLEEGRRLAEAWGEYYPVVRLGGPACDDHGDGFAAGVYVRRGVTFTSRGCPNRCPWCFVPEREGRLRVLPVVPGWIVQDNNLLATPRSHQERVYAMLKGQRRGARLSGGLEASRVDDWVAEQLRGLRIDRVFLAADTDGALPALRRAVDKLAFLGRRSNKLRCYVMIGYDGETLSQAEARLEAVWQAGCLPFAQLYRAPDREIVYSKEWRDLARTWMRPAAIRAKHSARNTMHLGARRSAAGTPCAFGASCSGGGVGGRAAAPRRAAGAAPRGD